MFNENDKIETISTIIHTTATTNGNGMRACESKCQENQMRWKNNE